MSRDSILAWRVVERAGPAQRVVLRAESAAGAELCVVSGYVGPELPEVAAGRLEHLGGARHALVGAGGRIEFEARTVEEIEMRPGLFAALHQPFALRWTERASVRALLALLRLPGGARLLRRWHAGRTA